MGSASPENRPDPDALLARANSDGRGQLKIFLGAAPGVGKTWEMLAAARRRFETGTDVVVGLVETHGRAETAEQLADLPVLPRRIVPYRGRLLEEFDLDAALKRRPALLLVDELAHANAPGLRHAKRWQDVAALLEAGINVWTTLNVQHLESLNDQVARITGIRVAETLPDTVLGLADDIELIDLPPEELRTRLKQGLVYRPDVARRALGGFFRPGNLAALREMALRRVAQHVDRDIAAYMRAQAIAGPWPAAERVMAVVEAGEAAEQVVRHASRLAEALRAPFFAFHAERAATGMAVQPALDLAIQLGGTVETTTNADVFAALLDAAARQNVAHIVIARGRGRWRWRRGLASRLARGARAYALHVVPDPAASRPAPPHRAPPPKLMPFGISLGIMILTTIGGFALRGVLPAEAMGYVFTAIVVGMASLYGRSVGIFAALTGFVLWNFFFLPPIYTLSVTNPRDVTALFAFLVVGVLTGSLAGRVRAEAETARTRIEALRRITLFGRALAQVSDEAGLAAVVEAEARALAGEAVLLLARDDGLPRAGGFDEAAVAAAEFAWRNRVATGMGTTTLPASAWRFQPLATEAGAIGVLGVRPETPPAEPVIQTLSALADQAALAAERLRLATSAAEARAHESTQRLRTALLSSLSHDLRTPLTAIRGAAETLAEADGELPEATRRDLLASIVEDVGRMTRFLANITGMARIETGEIVARHEKVDLAPVVEHAVARVKEAFHTAVNIPEDAATVRADPALLEQVLVNLLENAVKYGPEGGAISVFARRAGDSVVLSVADEGVGIPPEDLPHVFDSFFRVVRGDRVAPGTGLGLAIARAFVEAMGGTIAAESPRRDLPADGLPGTIIRVELPVP
ncbi:two-component sensor histidine kinase [Acidiphilium multivorum AIU301]|uniref:histidine kinase n=1 Tax=Acidiphilium multivorum (strain DSM 11245 / JCM 8867 / NBRC 100883 / AIU 301) TaxID=926570 RepID=F0IX96_ACIMA|nr:sensor histidine kinase KdpD [Acidiphilium multivorum]MBU6357268.1 sensor histidine kinase KdpD [Rhodospirillales bacterium]MDE2327357.1 sensor histidine kinase KdpD [Rhodospirillales bacterium]BAJ80506.1 two-component sensor histidine kinase [Acidiphilium multivorum AIU301]GAN72884.1 two component transcriptional regulator osmosensitive K+ channel signal transduction histidine kinase [Acidiphilium multivorum AIU301]